MKKIKQLLNYLLEDHQPTYIGLLNSTIFGDISRYECIEYVLCLMLLFRTSLYLSALLFSIILSLFFTYTTNYIIISLSIFSLTFGFIIYNALKPIFFKEFDNEQS